MGYICRTIRDKTGVAEALGSLSIDPGVIKELGEPLLFKDGQTWIFCGPGFICFDRSRILYAYTYPQYRRQGVLTYLYSKLPIQKWIVVASNSAFPFFQKQGFKIIKSYTNCHKLTNE